MSDIDRLEDLLYRIGTGTGGSYGELVDVAADAVSEIQDTLTPQIICTVEELEDLDPYTLIMNGEDDCGVRHAWGATHWDLPAVMLLPGDQVRAALKALEDEFDG